LREIYNITSDLEVGTMRKWSYQKVIMRGLQGVTISLWGLILFEYSEYLFNQKI